METYIAKGWQVNTFYSLPDESKLCCPSVSHTRLAGPWPLSDPSLTFCLSALGHPGPDGEIQVGGWDMEMIWPKIKFWVPFGQTDNVAWPRNIFWSLTRYPVRESVSHWNRRIRADLVSTDGKRQPNIHDPSVDSILCTTDTLVNFRDFFFWFYFPISPAGDVLVISPLYN